MSDRCIYTVLVGENESLLEQDLVSSLDIPLICFSDVKRESATWEVRTFDSALPLDSSRASRLPKILPHNYLPDYSESIYIDNSILLTDNPFLYIGVDNSSVGLIKHSFRNSLKDEFVEVIILELDRLSTVSEQYFYYKKYGKQLDLIKPLWGGMLFRKHMDPEVVKCMELWWTHVLRFSRRDQLSLPLILSADLKVSFFDYDNHNSQFHIWPAVERNLHQSKTWQLNHSEIIGEILQRPTSHVNYLEPRLGNTRKKFLFR